MRIDLAQYKLCIPNVRRIIKQYEGKRNQSQMSSIVSQATSMPMLAACYYVIGIMNKEDEGIQATIKGLIDFYNYTGVDNREIFNEDNS